MSQFNRQTTFTRYANVSLPLGLPLVEEAGPRHRSRNRDPRQAHETHPGSARHDEPRMSIEMKHLKRTKTTSNFPSTRALWYFGGAERAMCAMD